MSCDFHLRCATCHPARADLGPRTTWGADADFNHQGDQLLALVPYLPLFAQLAEAGFDVDTGSLGLRGSYYPSGLAAFARAHAEHVVQVWNEYGEQWPQRRRARVVDRRLQAYPPHGAPPIWPTPIDVLSCGHEVEVDPCCTIRLEGGVRSCPVCVEPKAPPAHCPAAAPGCILDEGHRGGHLAEPLWKPLP